MKSSVGGYGKRTHQGVVEFLLHLKQLNIKVWVDGDSLGYKAAQDALTPTLLGELKERKAELISFLRTQENANDHFSSAIPRVSREGGLPLSSAQRRLWFLNQLEPTAATYNIPLAYSLTGPLDLPALEKSLNRIVQRHESLRTIISVENGQPKQTVAQHEAVSIDVSDLRSYADGDRPAVLQSIMAADAQAPFDLAKGPLLRFRLLLLPDSTYVFLFVVHHIAFDDWSLNVFVKELGKLYAELSLDRSVEEHASFEANLPVQYVDFSQWQLDCLKGGMLEAQRRYWHQTLKAPLPTLQLPTDRPRPPIQTYNGGYHSLNLSAEMTQGLKALCQGQGVTLFMTLLASFKVLLHRYSGQTDVTVGSPIAGRNHPDIENLIGFFVNTLVLRTDLSGDPSFCDLLTQVRAATLAAYEHQDIPFEQLVEELQSERDRSLSPLFQVMFVLQNATDTSLALPGLEVTPVPVETRSAKFDLTLFTQERGASLIAGFEYNRDLFDAETIARMAEHWERLLEGIVASPDQPISKLPLLKSAERHQLLVNWNETQRELPKEKGIHQFFEASVELTPDAIAVLFEDQQLTYRELNQKANQLAHYLKQQGVQPGTLVGLCLERSLDMPIALLAILKAGGAYVPLDPAYPSERLQLIVAQSQLSILLTSEAVVQTLGFAPDSAFADEPHSRESVFASQRAFSVICLEAAWQAVSPADTGNLNESVQASQLAYILYTSGSTGQPKGVAVEHRSSVNFIQWALEAFQPERLAGVLASTSICFDLSVFEIFVPLSCGGKVILAENILHLPTLAAASQVTLINTVPSAMATLLKEHSLPKQVTTVNLAGEALSQQLVDQLYQQANVQAVFNLYGPSEATTYATFTLCTSSEADQGTSVSFPTVGRPIANTQIYLLDRYLQPVPIGVPGELHIGGEGLARGYFNRPDLTEKAFIDNPFGKGRLYKTGDLARYLPDGDIEFLGRLDYQVKIRGFRIEIGEIEAAVLNHPDVQQAVVLAREDVPGEKRLVAYLVSHAEGLVTVEALRAFLKQELPEYMVPSAFVFLPALPLTPNGKIDRRALPTPDQSRPELQTHFVPPDNPVEQQIADLWEQLLNVQQVGRHDNFFALGGHSLLVTQMMSRLSQSFETELSLKTLFELPTVAELGDRIKAIQWTQQSPEINEDYNQGEL